MNWESFLIGLTISNGLLTVVISSLRNRIIRLEAAMWRIKRDGTKFDGQR